MCSYVSYNRYYKLVFTLITLPVLWYVNADRFVEHGEYNGNLYGTTFDQVTSIVNAAVVCVLCCSPKVCLRYISEF